MKKKIIIKSMKISASVSSFLGVVLSFVSTLFDPKFWWIGLVIFVSTFIILWLFIALYFFYRKKRTLYKNGKHYIEVMYGDILKMPKEKGSNDKPLIIIPVNSSFDTKIEDDSVVDPIIRESSIHGQWIKKYAPKEQDVAALDKKISKAIKENNLKFKYKCSKRGKTDIYELGSSFILEEYDATCLLFALTEFDEHNKVRESNPYEFTKLMSKLLEKVVGYADRHVYIPVMGNNLGSFYQNTIESLDRIKNTAMIYSDKMRSNISIVIFENERHEVSLYD